MTNVKRTQPKEEESLYIDNKYTNANVEIQKYLATSTDKREKNLVR